MSTSPLKASEGWCGWVCLPSLKAFTGRSSESNEKAERVVVGDFLTPCSPPMHPFATLACMTGSCVSAAIPDRSRKADRALTRHHVENSVQTSKKKPRVHDSQTQGKSHKLTDNKPGRRRHSSLQVTGQWTIPCRARLRNEMVGVDGVD